VRAVRFHGPHDLRLEDLPLPEPGVDEVRILPEAVGLDGTDLHIMEGEFPSARPVVLGHEVAGVVDAVGSEVRNVGEGDLVTVEPHRYCGECRYCRLGREHLCRRKQAFGVHLNGGLAEAMVVPARIAYKLPRGVDARIGCLAEPVACCVHAMDRLAPVSGLTAVIFGAGPAGCILIRLAKLQGLSLILAVEPRASRREVAVHFGADETMDATEEGWEEKAVELTGGHGFDFAVDAVGSPQIVESAISLAARGGRVLVFGVAKPEAVASIKPNEIFTKELSIVGTVINPYTHYRAVELLPSLGLGQLEIGKYPLAATEKALAALSRGEVGKVEITPQS
jgi:L-iditol 2-dehydrogenase